MKVGVFTVLLSDQPFDKALDYLKRVGAEAVEIGTGNYPGNAHCPLDELLADSAKLEAWKKEIESRGLEISALSCHGNPLHPKEEIANEHHETWRKTLRLANALGVDTVINFSGCPGGPGGGTDPIWVVAPWPPDMAETLQWQWNEKVIPYWQKEVEEAKAQGVTKIALEMHPNFVVYNCETLLKLREAAGEAIGANFDPSHLFWQGMDPIACVRKLAGCIWHVHAKDCRIYPANCLVNGVLDTKSYTDEVNRSWIFRTVGYGHGLDFWNDFVSTLRMVGYDGVLSIEHEDSLMSPNEGLEKAMSFLKQVVISQPPGEAYWA